MSRFRELENKYPLQTILISGNIFTYRYLKNESSQKTLVLLTGGTGKSDLFLLHFEKFAQTYSVITFDYPIWCSTNQILVDAIAELLRTLNIKAYLVGQSLGGFIAQILAKEHPDVVEGLILSNTGTLSIHLNQEASKSLLDMIKKIDGMITMIKLLPFGIVKGIMEKSTLKTINQSDYPDLAREFCDVMMRSLTKEYEIYMLYLLKDVKTHWNLEKKDLLPYKDKVLLILSEDDKTFHDDVKQGLIDIMPNPVVKTDICGGHLSMLFEIEEYTKEVIAFLNGR